MPEDINLNKIDKINYLLDAINNNSEKFNALPIELQQQIKPFKDKVKRGISLTKEDYQELINII